MSSTALVTGANRGIGLELARQLSGRGDSVIATARDPESARELSALPVRVERLDVSEQKSVSDLALRLRGSALDLLIHNAGIGSAGPGLEGLEKEDLERYFAVNSIGPVILTHELLPNLRAGRGKKIVGISSGLGSLEGNTSGGWYGYRAAKAALNMFIRTMAAELRPEGFICVLMDPGWVRTDMGGAGAPTTPQESAGRMLKTMDRLSPSDTGRFLTSRGRDEPW